MASETRKTSRTRRILTWAIGLIVGIPLGIVVLSLVMLFIGANIAPGQRFIAREAGSLSGGMVTIEDFHGRFPDALRIRRLTVNDAKGEWLALDNLALNWSPLSLLHYDVNVGLLSADRIAVTRKPVSSAATTEPKKSSGSSSIPDLRIDLGRIHVGEIAIGQDVAGIATRIGIDGHVHVRAIAPLMSGVSVASLPDTDIALNIRRLDAPGGVSLTETTPSGRIALHLAVQDGAGGFVTTIGKLAQFDPATIALDLNGPRNDAALQFGLHAGPVTAGATGQIDLLHTSGTLAINAHAPAMRPMPGISWNAIALNANVHGDLTAPTGQGLLTIDDLAANGAGAGQVRLSFDGQEQPDPAATLAHLRLTEDGLRIPGPKPTLLASAPLVLDVIAHPKATTRPVTLALDHPLLHAKVQIDTLPAPKGTLELTLPDLKPLAAAGNVDLAGQSELHSRFAMPQHPDQPLTLGVDGTLGITGGQKQAVNLIGKDGKLSLALEMRSDPTSVSSDKTLDLKHFTLDGAALHLRDAATVLLGQKIVVQTLATLGLTDLSMISPSLRGNTDIALKANGPTNDLSANAQVKADFGTATVPRGPLTLNAAFAHLPAAPSGSITANGTLDRAQLALDAQISQDTDQARHLTLKNLHWNSIDGHGALKLPPNAKVPLGDLDVQITRLADFSHLIGQRIAGHLGLAVHTTDPNPSRPAQVSLKLGGTVQAAAATIQSLQLGGTVSDPTGNPDLDLKLALAGLNAYGVTGHADATARGTQAALALTAQATLQNVAGAPANLDAAALLDLPKKQVRVQRLGALAKGETVRLLGPALVSFGETMGVDRLRLSLAPSGVAPASIDVAGTLKPRLALDARIDHITPAIARPFAPTLAAQGMIGAQAHVTGTLEKPQGSVVLKAQGMKMLNGPAASLPAANLNANVALMGSMARIDSTLDAGSKIALALRGTAPTGKTGTLALNAQGHIDLSMANAVLGASGMGTSGMVTLAMGVGGTVQQPRATGQITLAHAQFDNYAQGVRLSDINGAIVAAGDTIQIQNILAHAGPGTIAINGSVGAFRPGIPVDLHIVSNNARPIASDLLTATIATDLAIHGQASTRLDVDGKVRIPQATINIPDSMPASVPQLDVIRPGQKVATSDGSGLVIGLDIAVISPGEFYVHGHGLDAEMMGTLHVGGTSTAPQVSGGFDLRRGAFNLAGVNLNFTHGRVGFNGAGVNHKLDPTLDFRADRNANGTLASLLVGGYASAPKISFTSSPAMPQEQVLSLLLFGTDSHSLSTTQLAELAGALATLTGGSSFDPLGKMRNALGLDRLTVGGGSGVNNGGTSVEAGKNVMKGVYVGAKQATSGSGTQAQVQVDLTKRLKLNTTVGTGGQVNGFTTPENDPGSSVGLSYGFDY